MRLNIPYTDHRELEEIAKVLQTGYFTQGPKVVEFEKMLAAYVGSRYAFATSSCTTALHLALAAWGVGPGDEVLVADFTFPATANVVVQLGAVPVMVDICLDTFTMDPADLERRITPRSKVILPVHAFGCSADMDPILEIAKRHNLAVLEDAACAIGTTYKGRFCGAMGTMGAYSFHPRKVITTGEGGMITTDDSELAERIQLLRSHGGKRTGYWYEYEEAGYNYRLSDILGAMGVAQMEKLDWLIERKRALAGELRQRMSHIPGVQLPAEPAWGGHIYQSFVTLLDDSLDRDRMVADLRAIDIESTLGTYAMHDQPIFQRLFGYRSGDLPNSHRAYRQSLTLPLYPQMEERDLDQLAAGLAQVVAAQRSK